MRRPSLSTLLTAGPSRRLLFQRCLIADREGYVTMLHHVEGDMLSRRTQRGI
jgi:hypothetical protein